MRVRLVAFFAFATLAMGCGQPKPVLTVTGSSTIAPLVADIAELYEKRYPVRVNVQSGGSSRGLRDVRMGLASLGMASRDLLPEEVRAGLTSQAIAWDGIALIVHRDNAIGGLSHEQVAAIYRGELRNWRDIGLAPRPITVVNKAEGRSTLDLFLQHFALDNADIAASIVAGENQQVIRTVAGNAGAIGYVSIGTAEIEAANGAAIKLLPLAGVVASVVTLQSGEYPLKRPLLLVSRGEPSPQARHFIDFVASPQIQERIRAHHFIPATP